MDKHTEHEVEPRKRQPPVGGTGDCRVHDPERSQNPNASGEGVKPSFIRNVPPGRYAFSTSQPAAVSSKRSES